MTGLVRHLLLLIGLLGLLPGGSAWAQPLAVDDRPAIAVWPGVTVWADADAALGVDEVLAQAQRFARPQGTPSNLGRSTQLAWLRIPLQVQADSAQRRVLEIDYPTLNQVDLYVVRDGRVLSHHRMGSGTKLSERALSARALAAPLLLAPGASELLLRVQSHTSLVLPMTLRTQEDFTRYESRVQLVQGIVLGLALCMLLYSLAHWVSLRDRVFLDYALLVLGNTLFSLTYFGIGSQYLWSAWPHLATNLAPMGIMVAVAAGARFVRTTLAVQDISRPIDRILRAATAAAMLGLAATLSGLLDYRSAQTLVTVLGIVVTFSALPMAAIRTYRGDPVGVYMLIGWAVYAIGALTTAGILRGLVEPGFWSQHVYPFSTVFEMSAWMAVLGLRVQAIHRNADRARVESETLRTMAHTDVLTGLPNRRGLSLHIQAALRRAGSHNMLAVYLMDLDNFKPVNDRYGHDVGDALLVAAGKRLQAQLRSHDVVARLGGDEFVVLVSGLADEAVARTLGQKLVAAFEPPFEVAGQRCAVGLTVGYALAPLDGHSAEELLRRADAAMYAGKQQAGQHLNRGGRAMVDVSSITA